MFILCLPVLDKPLVVVMDGLEQDTLGITPVWPSLWGIEHAVFELLVTQHLQLQLLPAEDVRLVSSQVKAHVNIIVTIL